MNLPKFSIRRPVTVAMFCLGLALVGAISLARLPMELYPNFTTPDISIIVNVRGGVMPPVEVEERITKLIEEAVGDVSHLKDVISISEDGRSRVVLTFEPGTDTDLAALEVREKFSRIRSELPLDEIEKPVIAKFEQEDLPVLIVAMTAPHYTPEMLRRLADEQIKDRLMRVEGVANVDVGGGRERKILVEIDLEKLQAFRLPIDRVTHLLSVSNLNLLAGEVDRLRNKYVIRAIGEFESIEEIEELGIHVTPTRSVIRIKDVASVKDSFLEATTHARVDTFPVVSLYIQKETTANTVKVVQKVQAALEEIRQDPRLSAEIRFITTYDQSVQIRRAIQAVGSSLVSGAVLAILVLGAFLATHGLPRLICLGGVGAATVFTVCIYRFALLPIETATHLMQGLLAALLLVALLWRHLRLTLIAALAIPLCTILTFGFMYFSNPFLRKVLFSDLSLNIMTLGGVALGIGMLVDNAIVVLENVVKHRSRGVGPRPAAYRGAAEMMLPLLASTITTLVVLLPIVFINKEIRILYLGFAVVICCALSASFGVALSVVPLLASRLSFPVVVSPRRRLWIRDRYRRLLVWCLRGRWIVALVTVFIGIAAFQIFRHIPKEFIGAAEAEDFTVFVELPSGAKLEISDEAVAGVEKVLNEVPEVKSVSSRIEKWSSKVYVKLVPLAQRSRSTKDVIDSIRPQIKEVERQFTEAFIYFEEPHEVETNEIILEIYGYDYEVLNQLAVEILTQMQKVPGLTDLKIRWRRGRPEWLVRVDKVKAARYGLTVREIAEVLHAQMRGLRATLYHTQAKQVEVVTRLEEGDRATLDKLRRLTFTLPTRDIVTLEQVARLEPAIGPSKIWRKNKQRMIQVSANRGRYAFGEAAARVYEVLKEVPVPEDYYWRFGSNYWKLIRSQKEFSFAFALSLVLVFLVLASLFESLLQPFIIMVTLFLAGLGGVCALLAFDQALNIGAFMGMILLGGVGVNNAIILVAEVNRLQAEGFRVLRALVYATLSRLRPILMTSVTTILGLMALALSRTEESSLWAPMALVPMGGLLTATFLTPLVVPSIYLLLEDIKKLPIWSVILFLRISTTEQRISQSTQDTIS